MFLHMDIDGIKFLKFSGLGDLVSYKKKVCISSLRANNIGVENRDLSLDYILCRCQHYQANILVFLLTIFH